MVSDYDQDYNYYNDLGKRAEGRGGGGEVQAKVNNPQCIAAL